MSTNSSKQMAPLLVISGVGNHAFLLTVNLKLKIVN